jgi:large subunit ribosomal protein L18
MNKKIQRLRRASKTRVRIALANALRLVVHRTNCHIYAQLVEGGKVLISASTLDKEINKSVKNTGNIEAAKLVGMTIAKKFAKVQTDKKIAFDRSGFSYHGRVKALADTAREHGMQF